MWNHMRMQSNFCVLAPVRLPTFLHRRCLLPFPSQRLLAVIVGRYNLQTDPSIVNRWLCLLHLEQYLRPREVGCYMDGEGLGKTHAGRPMGRWVAGGQGPDCNRWLTVQLGVC